MRVSSEGIFQSLLPRLVHLGLDRDELLARAGYEQEASTPSKAVFLEDEPLIHAAIEMSGDPLVAVRAIQLLPRSSVMAELASSMDDLRSAVRVVYEFAMLASERVVLELIEGPTTSRLVHRTEQTKAGAISFEWAIASIVAFFREVTENYDIFERVEFKHQPRTDEPAYRRALGTEVRFGCDQNCLIFPTAALDRPLVTANPGKVAALREALERHMLEIETAEAEVPRS